MTLPVELYAKSRSRAASPFDPDTLSWVGGTLRHYWHVNGSCGSMDRNSAGTGGFPDLDDPVGLLISGAPSNTYNLQQSGGVSGVRKAGGVYFPTGAFFNRNFSLFNPGTTGFTVGFRGVYIDDLYDISASILFAGSCNDSSPIRHGATFRQVGGQNAMLYGTPDFSGGSEPASGIVHSLTEAQTLAEQTILMTYTPTGGGAFDLTLFVNGVQSGDPMSFGSAAATNEERLVASLPNAGARYSLISRFLAAQDFSANAADISNFLRWGKPV
ncbi:MAG: hypothetical protein ACOY9J_03500 [Pseudomonadota bacterium]